MDFKGKIVKYKDVLFSNYLVDNDGAIYSKTGGKVLSPWLDSKGYPQVDLWTDDKHRITVKCHLVTAHTYIPIPSKLKGMTGLQVNHKNGNKSDYSIGNLEWMTPRENIEHAYNTDLKEGNYLEESTIKKICKYIDSGKRISDIRMLMGLPTHVISDIRYGRTYKHISKKYNFMKED
ncbi:MAG: HNH endonuclease [Paraclostridium sp.]